MFRKIFTRRATATPAPRVIIDTSTRAVSALVTFLDMYDDGMTADHLAERLTCTQLEALAELFDAFGRYEAASVWRFCHQATDEPGDEHYVSPDEDDESALITTH